MARPQQPELARSQSAPVDPDALDPQAETQGQLTEAGRVGNVPADNQPGHHPRQEQDKPDGAAFLARFRGDDRDAASSDAGDAGDAAASGDAPPPSAAHAPAPDAADEAASAAVEDGIDVPELVADGPDPAAPAVGEPVGAAPADLVDDPAAASSSDPDGTTAADLAGRATHLAEEAAQLARKGVEGGAQLVRKGIDAVKEVKDRR